MNHVRPALGSGFFLSDLYLKNTVIVISTGGPTEPGHSGEISSSLLQAAVSRAMSLATCR